MNDRIEELFRTGSISPRSISPELVLVDPELAALLRPLAVAAPVHSIQPPELQSVVVAAAAEPVANPPSPIRARPVATRPPHRLWGRVGWAVGLLAFVGVLGAAFAGPREAPSIDTSGPSIARSSQPAIVLSWEPVEWAPYYLVEVFHGQRLDHAASVTTNRLPVPDWLPPGRYTWSVRAGTGSPLDRRAGQPFEQGWFAITK